MKQSRLKSKTAWITAGASIVTALSAFGILVPAQATAVNGVVVAIASLLTVYGIFNDPTTKGQF